MNNKNLANAQLLNSITSTDTVFEVKQGQGVDLPSAPFYATITPLGILSTRDNSEIVQVTAVNIDELTVVRGQLDTVAKDFAADSVIANSIYVEDVNSKADRTTLIDALPTSIGSDNQVLKVSGGVPTWGTDANTTYSEISEAEITAGTSTTSRSISGRRAQSIVSKAQAGTVKDTGAQTMTGPLTVDGDIYSNGEKVVTGGGFFYNEIDASVNISINNSTPVDVTGYSLTVELSKNSLIEVDISLPQIYTSVDNVRVELGIWEGSTCCATTFDRTWSSSNGGNERRIRALIQASAGTHTYQLKAARNGSVATTLTVYANDSSGGQYEARGILTARVVG